ncbi:VWA domain-containing protein [bacterium]|nr:VWA domain-containing protein [bacterium]
MNKKLVTLGLIILAVCVIGRLLWVGLKSIKVDDFHPVSVIFIIDSSASNQKALPGQIKFLKTLCSLLDPEDQIKILKTSQNAYLIYEGSPMDTVSVSKALETFTKLDEKDYGTAYGEAMKKAVSHSLTMYKDGYTPSIVVIGDLENEGAIEKQINWETLPDNIAKAQESLPDLTLMFVYAHPEKLDMVKEKLGPVLGEKHLIVATEQMANKVNTRFLSAIGR